MVAAALVVAAMVAAVVQTAVVVAAAVVLTLVAVPAGPGVREKLAGVFRPRENPVLLVAAAVVEAKVVAVVTGKAVPVGLNPNGADAVEAAGTGAAELVSVKPGVTEEAGGTELTTEANRVGPAAGAPVEPPVGNPVGFEPKEKPGAAGADVVAHDAGVDWLKAKPVA